MPARHLNRSPTGGGAGRRAFANASHRGAAMETKMRVLNHHIKLEHLPPRDPDDYRIEVKPGPNLEPLPPGPTLGDAMGDLGDPVDGRGGGDPRVPYRCAPQNEFQLALRNGEPDGGVTGHFLCGSRPGGGGERTSERGVCPTVRKNMYDAKHWTGRPFTPRELARIHKIPNSFEFVGNMAQVRRHPHAGLVQIRMMKEYI